jgi:hypothetical protein
MPEPAASPLPRKGEVFFDVRGSSRCMRLSWYADTGVAVFSIWQGGMCTGTFRLPIGELPRMIETLRRGPAGQDLGRPPGRGRIPARQDGDEAGYYRSASQPPDDEHAVGGRQPTGPGADYAPDGGYGPDTDYRRDAEYPARAGYERAADHVPAAGYERGAGYGPDAEHAPAAGYERGAGYGPDAEHAPAAGYERDTGYGPDAGHAPAAGYERGAGYGPDTDYRRDAEYPAGAGYERAGYSPGADFAPDADHAPDPDHAPSAGYGRDADYEREVGYSPEAGYPRGRSGTAGHPATNFDYPATARAEGNYLPDIGGTYATSPGHGAGGEYASAGAADHDYWPGDSPGGRRPPGSPADDYPRAAPDQGYRPVGAGGYSQPAGTDSGQRAAADLDRTAAFQPARPAAQAGARLPGPAAGAEPMGRSRGGVDRAPRPRGGVADPAPRPRGLADPAGEARIDADPDAIPVGVAGPPRPGGTQAQSGSPRANRLPGRASGLSWDRSLELPGSPHSEPNTGSFRAAESAGYPTWHTDSYSADADDDYLDSDTGRYRRGSR